MSTDKGARRPMNTIVELSPDQAQISPDELDFSRGSTGASLSPLAQGSARCREPRARLSLLQGR